MPRKYPRPAARKRFAKLKEAAAQKRAFRRKAAPFLSDPRAGDGARLAGLAAAIFADREGC